MHVLIPNIPAQVHLLPWSCGEVLKDPLHREMFTSGLLLLLLLLVWHSSKRECRNVKFERFNLDRLQEALFE